MKRDLEAVYVTEVANMWNVVENLREFSQSFPSPDDIVGEHSSINWSTVASLVRINELLGEAISHADSMGE